MTSLKVVKGEPDDDELAAVVSALMMLPGRRKAVAVRDAAAISAWRYELLATGAGAAPKSASSWRQSLRRR